MFKKRRVVTDNEELPGFQSNGGCSITERIVKLVLQN